MVGGDLSQLPEPGHLRQNITTWVGQIRVSKWAMPEYRTQLKPPNGKKICGGAESKIDIHAPFDSRAFRSVQAPCALSVDGHCKVYVLTSSQTCYLG
jgi:hypothetical protein